jgi:hypothetical protein
MTETGSNAEPPFHLLLDQEEAGVAKTALNLLISDEAHEPPIRPLAREVLGNLERTANEQGILSGPLTPPQMKITHTAVKLLHDDLRYEHGDERAVLRRVLGKLPDEHTMRAISLD